MDGGHSKAKQLLRSEQTASQTHSRTSLHLTLGWTRFMEKVRHCSIDCNRIFKTFQVSSAAGRSKSNVLAHDYFCLRMSAGSLREWNKNETSNFRLGRLRQSAFVSLRNLIELQIFSLRDCIIGRIRRGIFYDDRNDSLVNAGRIFLLQRKF